jgi:hypothetical protein
MALDKLSVGEMTVDKWSDAKISLDILSVDEMVVD